MENFDFGASYEEPITPLGESSANSDTPSQLKYPLDPTSKAILKEVINEALPQLNRVQAVTLKSGDITFEVRNSDVMSVTSPAAVSITTISNGYSGQILTLIFNDANVTLVNDSSGAKNTINLGGANVTGVANTTLSLLHNGTSWLAETSTSISAVAGTIGGFNIGADYIRDVANSFGLASTVTGADDIRFWAGDTFANRATAPARISEAGVATFSSVVISGATSTFNGSLVPNVQNRAETLWTKDYVFVGYKTDGLTATVSGATITRNFLSTDFVVNGAANSSAYLSTGDLGNTIDGGVINWADGDFEFSCSAELDSALDQDVFFGLWDGVPAQNATSTDRHIGFYIQDGTTYISNGDGTTQTKTSVSCTLTNMNFFRFVFDTGVDVKFYINDTLVGTHTTNLPNATSGNEPNLIIWLNGAADGMASMSIKNNYLVTLEI